ncbi:PrsW family intramembrane metalloprotease [Candidatus Wolfebacteria bacterium]|nr:PrsW family intramembrane metalloprotease [Candidatus Wolfebacteria bacterium]
MVIFLLILGLLPSFAWLFFFLKEDGRPEPKTMIAKVFLAGAFITIPAVYFQLLAQGWLRIINIGQYDFVSFLTLAAIEEILKFSAAYFMVRKSRFFDEPIDAMIYLIAAALGFAVVENIAVMLGTKQISEAIGVIILRFVGATLLHALSSGIVGYYWARNLMEKGEGLILKGLVLATLLHGFFNYFIMLFMEAMIYPILFLVIIALFVFWDFEKVKNFSRI